MLPPLKLGILSGAYCSVWRASLFWAIAGDAKKAVIAIMSAIVAIKFIRAVCKTPLVDFIVALIFGELVAL